LEHYTKQFTTVNLFNIINCSRKMKTWNSRLSKYNFFGFIRVYYESVCSSPLLYMIKLNDTAISNSLAMHVCKMTEWTMAQDRSSWYWTNKFQYKLHNSLIMHNRKYLTSMTFSACCGDYFWKISADGISTFSKHYASCVLSGSQISCCLNIEDEITQITSSWQSSSASKKHRLLLSVQN